MIFPKTYKLKLLLVTALSSFLIVSAGMMYQLSTDTLCLLKLAFIYFGNVGFWLVASGPISKISKFSGNFEIEWLVKHLMLFIGLMLVNQIMIYGLVETVFRICFDCTAGYGTLAELQTNHFVPNILAYGIIVMVQHYFADSGPTDQLQDFLLIRQNGRQFKLMHADIRYVQADNNAIVLHAMSNRKYVAYQSLKSLEEQLAPDQFARVHRSTIVNREMVTEYQSKPSGDGILTLDDGTVVKVSRNYKAQLKKPGVLALL